MDGANAALLDDRLAARKALVDELIRLRDWFGTERGEPPWACLERRARFAGSTAGMRAGLRASAGLAC